MFDGENISFDASLVIYINSTNISPIMFINRIYETPNLLVAVAFFLPGRAKDLSAYTVRLYIVCIITTYSYKKYISQYFLSV